MLFPQVLPIPFHVHILNRQLITPVSYKKRGMNHSHKGIRLDCIFPLLLLKTPQASHPGILTLQGAEFTLLFLPITFLLGWQPVPPSCLSIHLLVPSLYQELYQEALQTQKRCDPYQHGGWSSKDEKKTTQLQDVCQGPVRFSPPPQASSFLLNTYCSFF